VKLLKQGATVLLTLLLLGIGSFTRAGEDVPVPEFSSSIVDTTSWLSDQELISLRKQIDEVKVAKNIQIAILIVATTKPEEISQYSIRVAEKWKVGKKGVDNGVLITLAKEDKKVRIDVGYGLEGAIPDGLAHRVIDEQMKGNLKKGNTFIAIQSAIQQISTIVDGENALKSSGNGLNTGISQLDSLPTLVLVVGFCLAVISAIFLFVEEGYAFLIALAIPIFAGVMFAFFYTIAIGVSAAIGIIILAFVIRFGLSTGGSVLSGGSFGGGGASGSWGDD
jgi:uncharacterized protein